MGETVITAFLHKETGGRAQPGTQGLMGRKPVARKPKGWAWARALIQVRVLPVE